MGCGVVLKFPARQLIMQADQNFLSFQTSSPITLPKVVQTNKWNLKWNFLQLFFFLFISVRKITTRSQVAVCNSPLKKSTHENWVVELNLHVCQKHDFSTGEQSFTFFWHTNTSHFHIDLSMDEPPRTPFSTDEQRHNFLQTNETVCNQLFGDRQTDRWQSHI